MIDLSKQIFLGNARVLIDNLDNSLFISLSKLLWAAFAWLRDTVTSLWLFDNRISHRREGNPGISLLNAAITPANIVQFAYASAQGRCKLL
jgi:hypothetical protein